MFLMFLVGAILTRMQDTQARLPWQRNLALAPPAGALWEKPAPNKRLRVHKRLTFVHPLTTKRLGSRRPLPFHLLMQTGWEGQPQLPYEPLERLPPGNARTFSSSSDNAVSRNGAARSWRRNSQSRSNSASNAAIRCVPTAGRSSPALASLLRSNCSSSVTEEIRSNSVGSFGARTTRLTRRSGEVLRAFFILFRRIFIRCTI